MNSPPSTPYTPMKSPPSTPYTPMKSPPAHTQKMNTYLDLPHPTEDYNSPLPLSVGRPFYKKRGNLYQKNSGTQRKSHEQAKWSNIQCDKNPMLVPLWNTPSWKPIFVNEEGGLQSQPGLLEDTFHRTTQNNTDMKSARELVLALSSPDLKIRSVLLRILLDANASPAVFPPSNRETVLRKSKEQFKNGRTFNATKILCLSLFWNTPSWKPIFVNEEGGLQSQPGLLEDTFHRTTQNNTDMKSARELVLALSSPDLKIRSVLLRILLDANASPAVFPPSNRETVLRKSKEQFKNGRTFNATKILCLSLFWNTPSWKPIFVNEEGGLQSQPGLLEDTFHRTTQNNTDMKSARELVLALSSPDLKIRSVLLRILLDANASPAVFPPSNRETVLRKSKAQFKNGRTFNATKILCLSLFWNTPSWKPIFVNEEGGLQSQPGLLEDTFHRTTQNNTDMKSARELVLALSSPDLKISVSITEDFIGCKRFASSFTTQQSEGSITEDFIGCKRFASSFTTQQSEGSITEDFIGCKRFASSFTTQQSEGSITEDFIGCKRFASSFSSQQSGNPENPRRSSRSTEIQGLG
ncbi:hypothetical protein P5673_009509 [Acropora cervicornis]|uniref:Uncharacterized protein n=1 Tax=Acropora cervicornis TaxID=6130 RepID=A0AAD9VA42_ACRCE|nr:hypothetical protein P5673_009509 [Acropora cervicornis]